MFTHSQADLEPHYSAEQIAESWGMSTSFVYRRFRRERGVVKFGRSLRIPRSVADRVRLAMVVEPVRERPKFVARRTANGDVVLVPRIQ